MLVSQEGLTTSRNPFARNESYIFTPIFSQRLPSAFRSGNLVPIIDCMAVLSILISTVLVSVLFERGRYRELILLLFSPYLRGNFQRISKRQAPSSASRMHFILVNVALPDPT